MASTQEVINYANGIVPNVWGKIITQGNIGSDSVSGNTRIIKGKLNHSALTKEERKEVKTHGTACQFYYTADMPGGNAAPMNEKFPIEWEIAITKNGRKMSVKVKKTAYTDFLFTITVTK
jgi:hypothetical protein